MFCHQILYYLTIMAKNMILLSVDKLMNIQNEISALTFNPFKKLDNFLLLSYILAFFTNDCQKATHGLMKWSSG